MPDIQLNLVVIRASDIDHAAAFYRLLGLEFQKHRHGSGLEHYASENGGIVFEIYLCQESGGSSVGTRIGFCVASVDAMVAEMKKTGAQVISPPKDSPWGRRAVVADPDGHRLELIEAR